MNNNYIISSKILFENSAKTFENHEENPLNFPLRSPESRYLIANPSQKSNPAPNSFKKKPVFVQNRNISTMRHFNKITINSSAPSLLTSTTQTAIASGVGQMEKIERFCKICFENYEDLSTGKLIAPCKCAGSVMFIHEECLKTWLISQNSDLKIASCELCHNYYKMDFKFGLKFYPKEAFRTGIQNTLALICLVIFLACLVVIIILFVLQW